MSNKNILDKCKDIPQKISNKYEEHLRKRAIKKVDEKILLHNLKIEDIEIDDYEAMITEAISEIKKEYAFKTTQVALSILGLDLLLG